MIRKAFTLRLKPGALGEYVERHEAIWPELVAEIERCGISLMAAFQADDTIFYYSEVSDAESWQRLWATDIHDRWAEAFKPLIAFDDEGNLVTGTLTEIWSLEVGA